MAYSCREPGSAHVKIAGRFPPEPVIRPTGVLKPAILLIPIHSYPASYDLRTLGRVTPVQVPECATCWATAAIASLESSLLPFENWDFSEDQLQLASGVECGGGGQDELSASTLTAWRAPVRESDYDSSSPYPTGTPKVVKHVQRIFFPPEKAVPLARDLLKYLIMYVGGVTASVSLSGWNEDPEYYFDPNWLPEHEVVLIGWDDNISRSKFVYENGEYGATPRGDGAFIVKGWGFYYISYYDGTPSH
jgi:C1A family cysteine protease